MQSESPSTPSTNGDKISKLNTASLNPKNQMKPYALVGPPWQKCNVNDPTAPNVIEHDHFVGRLLLRVKDWHGEGPKTTPYFQTSRRRNFVITTQARFKQTWSTDDVFFGAFFTHKVVTPSGTWIAMKVAKLIDPDIQHDLYSDNPWCCSSVLSAMNNVVVTQAPPAKFPNTEWKLGPNAKHTSRSESTNLLPPWPLSANDADNIPDLEDTTLLEKDHSYDVHDSNARRHYFRKHENRKRMNFEPEKVYNMSIYAPFLNMSTLDLDLGVKISCAKYFNGPLMLYMLGRKPRESKVPKERKGFSKHFSPNVPGTTFWPDDAVIFWGLEVGISKEVPSVSVDLSEVEAQGENHIDVLVREDGRVLSPTDEDMEQIVAEMSSLYSRSSYEK